MQRFLQQFVPARINSDRPDHILSPKREKAQNL
jgi:hypothetical protein